MSSESRDPETDTTSSKRQNSLPAEEPAAPVRAVPPSAELARLRELVSELESEISERPWFRGIGIGRDADGFTLRLNVDPEFEDATDVPQSYQGQPIQIVAIGFYKPRS